MPNFPPQHTSGPAAAADEFYAPIIPVVVELHKQGLSLRKIAAELDRREIRTRQICTHTLIGTKVVSTTYMRWNAAQIARVLDRARVARRKRRRSGKCSAPGTAQPGRSGKCSAPGTAQPAAPAASGVAGALLQQRQRPAPLRTANPPTRAASRGAEKGAVAAKLSSPGTDAPSAPVIPAGEQVATVAKGVYLRLGGQPRGPFAESEVHEMLKKRHVGHGTMGRWENSGPWQSLGELFALPEPIQTVRNRNGQEGSS